MIRDGIRVLPATPSRWRDLELLFGPRGAYAGCWCMWWRVSHAEFARRSDRQNKREMRRLVAQGQVPGLLAYKGRVPVAWCSLGPREKFAGLEHSRTLKRVDEQPVWSIVCFFVAREFRGQGIMEPLLKAAIQYASRHGAKIVEGYPLPGGRQLTGSSGYTGIASTFRRVGFVRVAQRDTRPIMRYFVESTSAKRARR
ncbi:MAG: N-acetyltransferase [Chloroflexi bacterium]|nr:N-acetyltransferase [Chloroflexota bacterium]